MVIGKSWAARETEDGKSKRGVTLSSGGKILLGPIPWPGRLTPWFVVNKVDRSACRFRG